MTETTFGALNKATTTFGTTHIDVDNSAAIAQTLPAFTQAAQAGIRYKGSIVQALPAFTQSAEAEHYLLKTTHDTATLDPSITVSGGPTPEWTVIESDGQRFSYSGTTFTHNRVTAGDMTLRLGPASLGTYIETVDYSGIGLTTVLPPNGTLEKLPNATQFQVDVDAWWRGDRGVTLNSSTASQWTDISNGVNATQATESNQPTYTASAINGKPGLTFDGADDHMRADALASAFTGDDKEFSVVMVGSVGNADTSNKVFLGAGKNGDSNTLLEIRYNGGSGKEWGLVTRDDAGTIGDVKSGVVGDTDPHIHIVISHGTTITWWLDNTKIMDAVSLNVGQITLDQLCIASRIRDAVIFDLWDGVIAEKAALGSALTDAEAQSITQYAASHYGISI